MVGLDRIRDVILQNIGLELVDQPNTTPFLVMNLQQHAIPLFGDCAHRRMKLLATVAPPRPQHINRQAPRMDTHKRR